MMGLKSAQPKLYYSFSLDAAVPKDHFLRRLDSVVDFSFVRGLTRQHYSHTGKPSVDPVVLFKLNLLGYLFNISSERRLCQEAGVNLAWRWFLGYELDEAIPDHSVLSKARGRFGPVVYERFFRHIVKLCEARGLIQGDVLFIDSTLVKANASLSSQRSRALQAQLRRPESFVAELWAVNEEEEEEPPPRPKKVPGRPRKPESERDESKSVTNRLAVSCVDPDAQWVKKSGRPPGLSHKAHMMVDGGRAAIVTAVEVRPSSEADGRAVQSMLAKHAMAVERGPRTLVGDRGYSSELAFKACLGLGVEPLLNVRSLANRFGFQRERFIYNPERDLFVC